MNAVALKGNKYDKILNDPNYIVEEKMKGIRAFVSLHLRGNLITSRGGHDISHRFPHIRDWPCPTSLSGCLLDGELYQEGVEDEVIAGWGNHHTQYIDASITSEVKLYTFDILRDEHELLIDEPLEVRKLKLEAREFLISKGPFKLLETYPIVEAERLFLDILSKGGEGIMLKNTLAPYWPGKRLNNNWYKLKGHQDFDVVLMGFEDAKKFSIKKGEEELTETKFKDKVGAFIYGMYYQEELIPLGTCSGMDNKIRDDMTFHPEEWLGSVIELRGVDQKESGAIDYPRFIRKRLDKEAKECIWIRE